ncbi:MAG: hypothetical protein PVF05_02635 [Gemmatimonadales bacterium]|jgi:hypothetical protein
MIRGAARRRGIRLAPVLAAVAGMGLLAPPVARAQETPVPGTIDASTPEAASRSLVQAIRAADYDAMADLMHPDALDELRELFVPVFRAEEMAEFRQQMFGVATADEALALSGRDIYRTIIEFAVAGDPTMNSALRSVQADVIGKVMEGDTAHVVYRLNMQVEGIDLSQTSVASFREHEGRWLGILTADLRGMIAGLRQALEAEGAGA